MFSVVLLQNRKKLVVPSDWVQHKNRKKSTKIFLSANENKTPDFSLETKYFIQPFDACYYGFFIDQYRKLIFFQIVGP